MNSKITRIASFTTCQSGARAIFGTAVCRKANGHPRTQGAHNRKENVMIIRYQSWAPARFVTNVIRTGKVYNVMH